MAEVIFEGIKHYDFMHSSHFVSEAIIKATSLGLESVKAYLDSQLCTINHAFISQTEKAIYSKQTKECPSMGEYGLQYTRIWVPESEIRKELFDPEEALLPMNLQYLDLPYIYRPTEKGFSFIHALTQCSNMDIFTLSSV